MFSVYQENYDEVKVCLKEIFQQIENLGNTITVDGKRCRLEFYFVSDWKMLAIVTGINGPTSKYGCIWCICEKPDYAKKKFSLGRHFPNYPKAKYGQIQPSLLPKNIPLTNVLMDTLHLFLRITDKFVEKIIKECRNLDNLSSEQQYNPKNSQHLTAFVSFMKDECNIEYSLFRTTKNAIQGRSLRGLELEKFIERINVMKIIPKYKNAKQLQRLIDSFRSIYSDLKYRDPSSREIKTRTRIWIRSCSTLFGNITPYMHAFHKHLCSQTKRHGHIYKFNLEGLEKQNDVATKAYFRSTNMKSKPVKQVLTKFLRIESAENELKVCTTLKHLYLMLST
jgi:hypothetical protein